jgi:hypothetical protein
VSNALSAALFFALLSSDDYCSAHLDQQLAWHREYGLPLPPPQAALVWYVTEPTESYRMGKKVVEPGSSGLGFSLDGRTVLYGAGRSTPVASITFVKPDAALVRAGVYIHWLQFAVVCHERGWKPLALAAIRKWTLSNLGWDTEGAIASDAWHHWKRRIHDDPGTPLPVIAKYLKRADPLSARDSELIRSIELALTPRNSPPGSDDALIDELVGLSGEEPLPYWWSRGFRDDPRYQAVVRRGLVTVPALIAHLDDERITRTVRRLSGLDNLQNLRVRDVVLDVLVQLHGGQFVLTEDTRNECIKVIGNWFADAHKLGEEKYVAAQILGANEKDDVFRPTLFWLLTERYPQRVPGVYRALIDTRPRHHDSAWRYAQALAEGPLPTADKRKALEYAARQENPNVRWGAIKYLRAVDPKLAHEILLAALANIPVEADRHDSVLAFVVAECADADEWRALGLAVRRADPGGRLELLQKVARATAPEGRKHRLALLAEYLTDDAVRSASENRSRFQWTDFAGSAFNRLEVRNFAAARLAKVLGVDADLDKDWTAAQWAELRARVRAKVKNELR